MKKIVVIITVIFCSAISLSAQIKFGLKAGLNLSTLSKTEIMPAAEGISSINSNMIAGYHFGGTANYAFNHFWGLQAEVLYSIQGSDKEKSRLLWERSGVNKLKYMNVPLLADIKPINNLPFSILAGVQMGVCLGWLSKDSDGETVNTGVDRKLDWSAVIGLQYTFIKHITIGLRYNHGFTPSRNSHTYTSYDDIRYSISGERNRVLQLSAGWTF